MPPPAALRLLAIDPGTTTGLAYFVGAKLVWHCAVKIPAASTKNRWVKAFDKLRNAVGDCPARWDAIAVEGYQAFGKSGHRAEQGAHSNGVITGTAIAAANSRWSASVHMVGQGQWQSEYYKGGDTLTKKGKPKRVKMDKHERGAVVADKHGLPKDTDHNVLDAVGIGDWAGRNL